MESSGTSMAVGSWLYVCHFRLEQVDPEYSEMCYLLCLMWPFQMALSAGSVSIDGAVAEVYVCSTPATGASFPFCSKLWLIGNK